MSIETNHERPSSASGYLCDVAGPSNNPTLEAEINRHQDLLGLRGSDVWREAAKFIDRTFLTTAAISGMKHPERIFGHEEWLGHLRASLFIRDLEPRQSLDIDTIRELHRLYAEDSYPEIAGVIRKGPMWPVSSIDADLTPQQIRAITSNPGVDLEPHKKRAPFSLTRGLSRTHIPMSGPAIRSSSSHYNDRLRLVYSVAPSAALEELCRWHNDNPKGRYYYPGSELQQKLIGYHPFPDYNGRTSRAILNLVLGDNGLPPAILSEVNDDLYTMPEEWGVKVKMGSRRHEKLTHRLATNPDGGSLADLLGYGLENTLFRIANMRGLIDPPPLTPGQYHTEAEHREFNERIIGRARRLRIASAAGELVTTDRVEALVESWQ